MPRLLLEPTPTVPLNLVDTKFQDLKELETPLPPCDHAPRSQGMSEAYLQLIG